MNYKLLYQLEQHLSAHLPCFNGWQQQNVSLFSYGVIQAESCQQGAIARAVSCGEQVESTARRFRRWLANKALDLTAFFAEGQVEMIRALLEAAYRQPAGSVDHCLHVDGRPRQPSRCCWYRPTARSSSRRVVPAALELVSGRLALLRASCSTPNLVFRITLYPRHKVYLKTCPLLSPNTERDNKGWDFEMLCIF